MNHADMYLVYLRGHGGNPQYAVPIGRPELPVSWWGLLHSSLGGFWKEWKDGLMGFDFTAELVYVDGLPYQIVPVTSQESFEILRMRWRNRSPGLPTFNFETQGRQYDGENQL